MPVTTALILGYSAPPRRADGGVRQIAVSTPVPAPNRQVRQQVPTEQVVEGDFLEKRGILGTYPASFNHTSRYTTPMHGESFLARCAVAEYWSLSLMESGRVSPFHRIDDYA